MSFTIQDVTKRDTAYDKEITFIYKRKTYSVLLHWDTYDGYDITFNDIDDPKWAINWEDNNDGESLAYVLDGLTDEKLEEVE